MNKKIAIFSLIFIAFLTLFGSANLASARTISTCDSATLKGSISSSRNNPTTVWFEWGKGRSESNYTYNRVTQSQTLTRSGSFNELLTGLSPDTTYYYRAIAQNRDGVIVGDLETFKTSRCSSTTNTSASSTTTRVVYQEVPVIKTVYTPASANMTSNNYYSAQSAQNYRTIPIASSSSSNNFSNQSTAMQNPYQQSNLSANTAGFSMPFNLYGLVIFAIFLLLIALVAKRILFVRSH